MCQFGWLLRCKSTLTSSHTSLSRFLQSEFFCLVWYVSLLTSQSEVNSGLNTSVQVFLFLLMRVTHNHYLLFYFSCDWHICQFKFIMNCFITTLIRFQHTSESGINSEASTLNKSKTLFIAYSNKVSRKQFRDRFSLFREVTLREIHDSPDVPDVQGVPLCSIKSKIFKITDFQLSHYKLLKYSTSATTSKGWRTLHIDLPYITHICIGIYTL